MRILSTISRKRMTCICDFSLPGEYHSQEQFLIQGLGGSQGVIQILGVGLLLPAWGQSDLLWDSNNPLKYARYTTLHLHFATSWLQWSPYFVAQISFTWCPCTVRKLSSIEARQHFSNEKDGMFTQPQTTMTQEKIFNQFLSEADWK